jgi:uncharacterized protein YjbJ (UPF0337 family)
MDLEKSWEKIKKEVSKKWDKLTHEDVEKIKGKKNELVEALKTRYKWTKEDTTKKVDEFLDKLK